MISEPLPEGGWSTELRTVRDAVICPAETHADTPGVWADGDVEEAATWRGGIRLTGALTEIPEVTAHLDGRHMWGGIYFGHFGHFLVETISRLWAVRQAGAQGVLFTPRHGRLQSFVTYQKELIDLVLPRTEVRIIREPTRVEELVIPGQGFGLGKISAGTAQFRAFIREALADIEPADIENVYISRTRFGGKGGIINEQRLERLLEAEGYTAVHPERLSLREQFSIFKGARNILGLDGSAFHVLGYVANPDQRAGIIIRRSSPAYHHIAEHLRGFTGRPPEIINHLAADWMPDRQKLANHVSWGELDFDGLGQTLARLGFIADARNWCNPDPEEMAQSVERAATRTQEPLVRRLAVL
ncbi:MAG TPA: glycosyltransferase 61 family protein [Paracoccus sp. (in: a-proteobacteria)]|nr:glycosyltransferase 61 family protein [Paracoccus sp. (in: a-proteobacteria)]